MADDTDRDLPVELAASSEIYDEAVEEFVEDIDSVRDELQQVLAEIEAETIDDVDIDDV